MPISRLQVQGLCTKDEFEMYSASLRISLARMRPAALRTCIRRTRELLGPSGARPARKNLWKIRGVGILPRKGELLAGALSRFEGRLRALESE
jgi:hypothetical protein